MPATTAVISPDPVFEGVHALPFHIRACPVDTPDVSTSDNALILDAPIRASALASVKYKLVEPSDKLSVFCPVRSVKKEPATNSNALPAPFTFTNLLAAPEKFVGVSVSPANVVAPDPDASPGSNLFVLELNLITCPFVIPAISTSLKPASELGDDDALDIQCEPLYVNK